MNTPNVVACAVYKFHFQKWSFSDLSASTKPQTKWKLAFQKYKQLSNSFFKMQLQNCVFPNFKFHLLSPISALLLPTCSTPSFQKIVEKVRNYMKEVWLILKKWVWRVDFERFFLKKKTVFFLVKWLKTNAFFFDRQDEGW